MASPRFSSQSDPTSATRITSLRWREHSKTGASLHSAKYRKIQRQCARLCHTNLQIITPGMIGAPQHPKPQHREVTAKENRSFL